MLPICCYPVNKASNRGTERIQQYIVGLSKFFEYNDILKKNNIVVYLVDNSIKVGDTLPQAVLNIIPDNVIINTSLNNKFGRFNKGAGLIEQWLHCNDIIEKYDWFIHFEPRQLLLNFNFINNFLENPRNLFIFGTGNKHFNTGLFCIQSNKLLDYSNKCDLNCMVSQSISIEYDLYNYMLLYNVQYDILDKLNLVWFDYTSNKSYYF
jgi:hypothetical protein